MRDSIEKNKASGRCPSRVSPGRLALVLAAGLGLFLAAPATMAQSDCIDDITGRTNVCTANDVRVSTISIVGGTQSCTLGETITLDFRAELVATASERYDIGLFVAEDAGDARTGMCYHDYLPAPLFPNNPPTCSGTCSISGTSCIKNRDCPSGETCTGGYDGLSGTGPYYDAECSEDPGDTCGDLQQGVTTFRNFTATITCEDMDGDGSADVGSCVSWDNQKSDGGNKPSCLTLDDTKPGTKSKCRCEQLEIEGLIPCPVCDDDDVCNGVFECDNLQPPSCIQVAPPLDCDDGNICTDDSCDPVLGCVNTPNSAPCDDGDACTTNDVCSGGVCVGGPALDCDDGNVCTDDSCNPATGCVNTNNSAPCDDGDACTTGDTCSGGVCVGGPPPDCDDGNICTDDSCNPATGCVNTPNSAPCDDGDACTTGDTCSGGVCVGGPPPDCDDGNVCTDDSCNPATGCVNTPNSAPCDDGDACTT
ncbi:MAG: hypothetical protein OEQ13_06420, partial [Acidobacteriota bacterium]|nr:hypothetical protein [Acidobacteriota bacterium]